MVTVAKLICGDGSCFDGTGLTVDVERPLTADEQVSYYDYTLDTDPQIQRAVSTAQQLTGVTTVGGVNDADIAADSAAASSEAAAESTLPARPVQKGSRRLQVRSKHFLKITLVV